MYCSVVNSAQEQQWRCSGSEKQPKRKRNGTWCHIRDIDTMAPRLFRWCSVSIGYGAFRRRWRVSLARRATAAYKEASGCFSVSVPHACKRRMLGDACWRECLLHQAQSFSRERACAPTRAVYRPCQPHREAHVLHCSAHYMRTSTERWVRGVKVSLAGKRSASRKLLPSVLGCCARAGHNAHMAEFVTHCHYTDDCSLANTKHHRR